MILSFHPFLQGKFLILGRVLNFGEGSDDIYIYKVVFQKGTVKFADHVSYTKKAHINISRHVCVFLWHTPEHISNWSFFLFQAVTFRLYGCTLVLFSAGFECKSPDNSAMVELIVSDHPQLNFWSSNGALNIFPAFNQVTLAVDLHEMIAYRRSNHETLQTFQGGCYYVF